MMDGLALTVAPFLIILFLWWKTARPKNFPPGPPTIPFVGNILSFGKLPHLKIHEWTKKYGDVFSVYNGTKRIVVLSDFHTLRKVFALDAVTGRNNDSVVRVDASTQSGYGLIFTEGELWKTHRRFALSTLRDLGMGKNWLEDAILAEVEGICQTLRETDQRPFDPKVQLTNSVANVICGLIFGQRFTLTDPKFIKLTSMVTENLDGLAVDSLAWTFPFLMWFPNRIREKVLRTRKNMRELTKFLKGRVDEHDVTRQAEHQHYLNAYQKERETGNKMGLQDEFDERQLLSSLSDLFGAGTETTSTTTLWALVLMVENPDIMRKVQEEIDMSFSRERMLTNADRHQLPYTEAVILEVQRCANLVPLVLPHKTQEEITIGGYTIPKDTLVTANLFSIHRDPRWWQHPELFDPTRFLAQDGRLKKPDGFAPFSVGKRACLGEALAKMELFLFIANILRSFTVTNAPGKCISSRDSVSRLVHSPMPFEVVFVPRF